LGDVTTTKSDDVSDVSDSCPEKRLAWRRIGPLAKDRGHDEIEVGNKVRSHGAGLQHSHQKEEELCARKPLFKSAEMQVNTSQTATVVVVVVVVTLESTIFRRMSTCVLTPSNLLANAV
jgi:hypothetical protein